MADIKPTAFISPLPVAGVPSSAVAGNSAGLGPILASLTPGTLISGFVLNRDTLGNPILRTAQGDLLIQTELFLKIGSDITARVEQHGSRVEARILTVDGLPPAQAARVAHVDQPDVVGNQPTRNAPPNAPGNAPLPPAYNTPNSPRPSAGVLTPATITDSISRGPALEAVVLGPSARPGAPVPSAPLPPGSTVSLQLATSPAPAASGPQVSAPPVFQAAAAPAVPGQPTPPPVPVANPPALPAQIQATVIASQPDGSLIAQSPLGLLKLPIFAKLGQGGTMEFKLVSATLPAPGAPVVTAPVTLPPGLQIAQQWPAMQEIVDSLLHDPFAPKDTLALIQSRIPWVALAGAQGGAGVGIPTAATFTSPMLFFMAGLLGGGSARQWLGGTLTQRLEEGGHAPLLDQADAEFSQLSQLARNHTAQGWQSLFFPVMTEEQIQMARLFVRRDRKGKGTPSAPDDTRFMVEVELSQIGELQLDGLVRKSGPQNTVFDLMIRSREPLPEAMQRDIIAIYDSAGELTGYRGTLLFQQVHHFPPGPLQELLAHTQDDTPDILA